jgi:omega-6 fatty acid desaturase (delta-12 desaturase)
VYSQAPETIAQVKAHVPESLRKRSFWIGPLLLLLSATCYTVTFALTLSPLPIWLRVVSSLLNAVFIATLFIVGHDACHGSLTPKAWLNKLIGRLAFLPSWHPYISWDLGHNRIHHSWTNLKGRDYVWTPLSPQEFRNLSPRGRFLHRFYRSFFGIGFYYLSEVWFKHMIFPRSSDKKRMSSSLLAADRSSVALFVIAQVTIAVLIANQSQSPIWLAILLAVVLPQLLWNQLMGLVILLHHTHPKVRWFDDLDEWSFFNGQVRGTVHIKFPWPIGAILHHIMDHTAHHVDPRIPLYHLPEAQVAMEQSYPSDVIVSPFSFPNLRKILRECQLYDYSQHRWLPFSHVTSESHDQNPLLLHHVTVEEASTHLSIPLSKLYHFIENGQLQAVQNEGRYYVERKILSSLALFNPPSNRQLRVMIVDDDSAIHSLFQQFLSNIGCHYLGFKSVPDAISAAHTEKIDLVFLDLHLPDISGDQAFSQLKSSHPNLPIAIVTGFPDSEILSRILSHGPVMVIKKPLELAQLQLAIEQLAGSSSPAKPQRSLPETALAS